MNGNDTKTTEIVFVRTKTDENGIILYDAGDYWTDDICRAKIITTKDNLVGARRAKAVRITKDWVVPVELIDKETTYLRAIAEESIGKEEVENVAMLVNSFDFGDL